MGVREAVMGEGGAIGYQQEQLMGWGMGMGEAVKSNTGVVAHQLLLGVATFVI